ncbi:hypothetical protein [Sphingobacterium detergens]
MRRALFFLLAFFLLKNVNAQKDIEKNIISIPPSPTAAELGKYGMMSVDEYNGLPQISIPIYTFSVNDISVPIGLSYNYNGLQPNARASWVGIGWSCSAGGVITRSMKGFPDESIHGYNNTLGFNGNRKAPDPISDPINFKNYFENLPMESKVMFASGVWDSQPDSYYFNFQGKSGKLMFTDKGIKTIPYLPLKITKTNDLWEIIDENGFKYLFGNDGVTNGVEITAPDDTQDPRINPYASSWYLISITSPNGAIVKFKYDEEGYRVIPSNFQRFVYVDEVKAVCMGLGGLFTSLGRESWISAKKLVSITSGKSTVSFIAKNQRQDIYVGEIAKQLDSIKIFHSDVETARFGFEYAYLGNRASDENKVYKKLQLKKFFQENINGNKESQYDFDYIEGETPELNTYAIDHWGYYNGKSNSTLIPSKLKSSNDLKFRKTSLNGDRDPDHNFAKIGLLRLIRYPTKGQQEFIYEPNDYSSVNDQGLPIEYTSETFYVTANVSIPVSGPRATKEQKTAFTIETAQFVDINYQIRQLAQEGLGEQFVSLMRAGEDTPVWSEWSSSNQFNTSNIYLSPGNYTLIAHIEDKGYSADVNLTYDKFDQNAPIKFKLGGGFRIKTIKNYALDNLTVTERQDYIYRLASDTTLSTGILSFGPRYEYPYRQTVEIPPNHQPGDIEIVDNRAICRCTVRNSNSIVPLSTGGAGYVSYPEVKILYGLGLNGYTTKRFTSIIEYPNEMLPVGPPFADPRLQDRFHGLLLKEDVFDHQGRRLTSIQNNYTMNRGTGDPNRFSIPYLSVSFDLEYPTTTIFNKFHTVLYGIETNWKYLNSTKRTSYFYEPTTSTVVMDENYYYDNAIHCQLTRKERNTSYGNNAAEYISYPLDFSPGNSTIDLLRSKNILSSPIEHVSARIDLQTGTKILSGRLFKYKAENVSKPFEIWEIENPSVLSAVNFKFSNKALGTLPPVGGIEVLVPDSRYKLAQSILQYDSFSNPREVKKQQETSSVYLWGYNGQYPIVEIRNATYTDVVTVLTQVVIDNLNIATHSEGTMETLIKTAADKLRNHANLSKAMVISYTYKPLVGMTSKTDPRGVKETYKYDGMQRLQAILDQVGNVTKAIDYHYRPN